MQYQSLAVDGVVGEEEWFFYQVHDSTSVERG